MMKKDMNQSNSIRIIVLIIILMNFFFINNVNSQELIKRDYISRYYHIDEYVPVEINYYFYDSSMVRKEIKNLNDSSFIDIYSYKYDGDSLILHGKSISYIKGKKSSEGYFVNGERNGFFIDYYSKNGAIRTILNYSNGFLNGNIFEFYENGNIQLTGCFEMGLKIGFWKYYFENGYLQAIGSFSQKFGVDNKLDMSYNIDCKTSNFLEKKIFEDKSPQQLRSGLWKFYNCDGELIKEIEY